MNKLHLVVNVTRDKRVHEILEKTISRSRIVSAMFERHYTTSREDLLRSARTADVLFSFSVPEQVILTADNLKWLHFASAGVEKSLLPALMSRNIRMTCSRGIHARTIAEYVMMQALAFSKNLCKAYEFQKNRRWRFEELADGKFDLEGKTICIIGLGAIGSRVAKLAKAFDMRVIGTVNRVRRIRYVDRVYPPSRLGECLKQGDVVVLSTPLTKDTYQLIGARELSLMKKNALLINIARGNLIDEKALVSALQKRRIRAAALDVFEAEPLPSSSPFWSLDNVFITPHYSGMAENLWEKTGSRFCENAIRFKQGKKLLGVVSRYKGY